jgi:hypothetical protein
MKWTGGQIRQPVRRRLVRHGEGVAQVLHGDVTSGACLLEQTHRLGLRDQHGGREVVDLDPLTQEVGVAGGLAVTQDDVTDGLEDDLATSVAASVPRMRDEDALVPEVDHRSRGVRQIGLPVQREAQSLDDRGHVPFGEGSVARVRGRQELACGLLDLGEVVVAIAHDTP